MVSTMVASKSIVILFLCCAARAISADFCSDEKGIENFNLTAFQGVWYFAYKYGTRISVSFGDACMRSDHTMTKTGFQVLLEYYDSKKKRHSFVADVPRMKEGGSYFEVNSEEQNMHMYTVLLETDYDNYLTEYFCLRGQMAEGYIRTRSRNPSPEILNKAKKAAKQRVPEVEPFVDLGCSNTDI
nr:unnamed protein product [Callosobruchus chinensis]